METIVEKIKLLMAEQSYSAALELIERQLALLSDIKSAEKEEMFTQLVGMRVAAKTMLGQNDNVILDFVRREKFPSEQKYVVDKNHLVTLSAKNLFLFQCDAMINTIHVDRLFDVSERSASKEFIDRLGRKELDAQIGNRKLQLGD